ncbi:putative RTX-family protein [Yersinia frederiksenii]|nr:putative RTX-family protein [Yersinia frederiksenii]
MSLLEQHSFDFSQGRDLVKKLETSLYEIGYYSVTPRDVEGAKKISGALCYALSTKFMMEERNGNVGGGKRYFSWLQRAVDSYKQNAQIVDRDPSNIQSKLLMQYYRQFLHAELKRILILQNSQHVNNNYKEIKKYFGGVANLMKSGKHDKTMISIYALTQEIKEKSIGGKISHNDLIDSIEKYVASNDKGFKNTLNEIRKKGNDKIYLINDVLDNLIEQHSKKNRVYSEDGQHVMMPKDKVESGLFGKMLGAAIESEKIRAADMYGNLLLERGLIRSGDRSEEARRIEMKSNLIESSRKLKFLLDDIKHVSNNTYISISSSNHTLAISIVKNENNKISWTFFDPNFGAKTFDSHTDLQQYIHGRLNEKIKRNNGSEVILGKYYHFPVENLETLDFSVAYIKYEDDKRSHHDYSASKISQDGEQAYIIKSLKENKIIFDLSPEATAKVIDFSARERVSGEWQVKSLVMEVTADGKVFNVHMLVDSFDNALTTLKPNIDILINYKKDNPTVMDIDFTKGVIKRYTASSFDLPKPKSYSEISVYNFELESLSSRTKNAIQMLDRLAEGRISLTQLSSETRTSLAEFLDDGNDILANRNILKATTDSDYYLQLRLELSELQQVSVDNPQLESIKVSAALEISKQWHINQVNKNSNFLILSHKLGAKDVTAVNQILTLSPDLQKATKKQIDLGILYFYSLLKGNSVKFKEQLLEHKNLTYLKSKNIVTDNENRQLTDFHYLINTLNEHQYSDIRHFISDGFLNQGVKLSDIGHYQLMTNDILLNIAIERDNGQYLYRIYDTEGGEFTLSGKSLQEINEKLNYFIGLYTTDNNNLASNQSYKLYRINLSDNVNGNSQLLLENVFKQSLTSERQRLTEQGNIFFNGEVIALHTLYDMGATLDGKIISVEAILADADWQHKLRFDPLLLNEFYILPDGSSIEQQQSVKVLRQLLTDDSNHKILDNVVDSFEKGEAIARLNTIKHHVESDGNIDTKLWHNLTLTTATSRRFQLIGQTVGGGTQTVGFIMSSISTSVMVKRLQHPDITDKERDEIRKQLAIIWGSRSVDIGTDLMQPTFDKLHNYFSKKLLSGARSGIGRTGYSLAAKSAKYAGAVLNIASAGFDIHDAVDNFDKAANEENADLKTDYLVNGSLATIGAVVSITTAVALALGFASAGPIGIIVGSVIMLAGAMYNAIRQTQYIKEQVKLSVGEEIETGWNLFVGGEPPESVRIKLAQKNQEDLDKYFIQSVKDTLKNQLQPMGFNRYIHGRQKFNSASVTKYAIIHKDDEEYEKYSKEELLEKYPNLGSRIYSEEGIRKAINRKYKSKSSIERYFVMRYQVESLNYFEYNRWLEGNTSDKHIAIKAPEISYRNSFTRSVVIIKNYDLFNSYNLSKDKNYLLSFMNDKDLYEEVIDPNGNDNTHFHIDSSNNIIFGYGDAKNSFNVSKFNNILVGGQKDDVFSLSVFLPHSVQVVPNFLDGQGGSDTLLLSGIRIGKKGFNVNLLEGFIYIRGNEDKGEWAKEANFKNIDNVITQACFDDILFGNNNANYINGVSGYDIIYGLAGDDKLQLSNGVADGGADNDLYIITAQDKGHHQVKIIDSGLDEISSILMPYTVTDLESISLADNDVILRWRGSDRGHTIILKNAYKQKEPGSKRVLNHNYIFTTSDGFILSPNWPKEVDVNANRWLLSFEMSAVYNYLSDTTLYKKGEIPKRPEKIKVFRNNNSMLIDKRVIKFPYCVKPLLIAYPASQSTLLTGDIKNNSFHRLSAGSRSVGLSGDNRYEISDISRVDNTKNSFIDIEFFTGETAKDIEQNTMTIVFNDVNAYDLNARYGENHSILYIEHRDRPAEFATIRIKHLDEAVSSDGKKLITLIDENKKIFHIDIEGKSYEILENNPTNITATNSDDNITMPAGYRLKDSSIELLGGHDVISDWSGRGNIIKGGSGNDIIYASGGNNNIQGGTGDDQLFSSDGNDILRGGAGNDLLNSGNGQDSLDGGKDDDVYLIEKGYGKTIIYDNHGKNTVIFKDIDYRALWFKVEKDNLTISIKDTEKKLVIKDYYLDKKASPHFAFQTNNHKIEGDNLDSLISFMARAPDSFRHQIQDSQSRVYGADLHRVWTAITAG